MSRDKELDALERELHTPFIEKPDEIHVGHGMLCWKDRARSCGPDCVAYNPEGADDGANQCVLLVYKGQQASLALAQTAIFQAQLRGGTKAPIPNPPPPDPMPRKR